MAIKKLDVTQGMANRGSISNRVRTTMKQHQWQWSRSDSKVINETATKRSGVMLAK
jgi:hypothetical protein